jgi:hypothetical protein
MYPTSNNSNNTRNFEARTSGEKKTIPEKVMSDMVIKNYRAVYEIAANSPTIAGAIKRRAELDYKLEVERAALAANQTPIHQAPATETPVEVAPEAEIETNVDYIRSLIADMRDPQTNIDSQQQPPANNVSHDYKLQG